ncbi:MAG: redox-sensing transcriptional repressor Rex [Eubacteriales bacterium]|nr:redox-sensing transcriptional repressor Rex [Eubacteriales bacterium]
MSNREISTAVIKRLPRYYRYLGELSEAGVERISSRELSQQMKVTASQIRQDLNNFGGFGQQGYGYNVQYLREEIARILGLDRTHNMVIIGAGNLGMALANYAKFERNSFRVICLFDSNPELKGKEVRGIPVRMIEELPEFLRENSVEIAALTIPKEYAITTAKILVENGIQAIWNFAHTDLNLVVPKNVAVENVHLSESLMRLSYNLKTIENEK